MGTQAIPSADIKGLTPSVEPMNTDALFALSGKNYIFDSLGPKSFYGNRLLTPCPVGRSAHVQGFKLKLTFGDRVFVMFADCIAEWVESTGGWNILYVTPDTSAVPHRWTFGYLNGVMYFCHPRTGILGYVINTGILAPVAGPGVPSGATAITINNGRLIAIDSEYYYWSAGSDGSNFNPELGGPGFQRINDRVAGDPIMVTAYSKGTLTWCTGGVMRSEFTGDVEVYRHRAINSEYRPINSFCTIQVDDDQVVILDERGLFSSRGESPVRYNGSNEESYAGLFNEFLIQIIRTNKLRQGQNIRLEYDALRRLMYVSVSLSTESPLYERCYVYYPPLDKWGQFSEPHYGILPSIVSSGSREDDYFAFVDGSNQLRIFEETGSREAAPTDTTVNLFRSLSQKPGQAVLNTGYRVLAASGRLDTFDSTGITQIEGYYPHDGATPVAPTLTGLGASLRIGLVRIPQQTANDEMTEIVNIKVANVLSDISGIVAEDYNLVPTGTSDEDYNVVAGMEDYGLDPSNYINHGLHVISTIDGKTVFTESYPTLVTFSRSVRYYACSSVGVWHIIELTATEIGETFHLQSLELTAAAAGRLM